MGLFLFQPVLGLLHHLQYRKKGRRTPWSYGHIWFGRVLLILATIDGGLGLQLSANTTKGEIAYGVIVGVIFLVYVMVAAVFHLPLHTGRRSVAIIKPPPEAKCS